MEHCYDLITKGQWPPSSFDLNLMDNITWGYLEAHTNRRCPHSTKARLIASIKENITSLLRDLGSRPAAPGSEVILRLRAITSSEPEDG